MKQVEHTQKKPTRLVSRVLGDAPVTRSIILVVGICAGLLPIPSAPPLWVILAGFVAAFIGTAYLLSFDWAGYWHSLPARARDAIHPPLLAGIVFCFALASVIGYLTIDPHPYIPYPGEEPKASETIAAFALLVPILGGIVLLIWWVWDYVWPAFFSNPVTSFDLARLHNQKIYGNAGFAKQEQIAVALRNDPADELQLEFED